MSDAGSGMDELFDDLDAVALAAVIRVGDVHAREVVEHALARIDARNPIVNAVTEVRADAALVDADTASGGPLAGVPFVIKDLGAEVSGMRTTGGSRLRADEVANQDSIIVERYRRAGLVVVGMTNVPEYGRNASTEPLLHGPTRNPYSLSHSAGGSSGGTAAAIASAMVPLGHGNDGGGSIRIPASACGLVGLKPTRGRTPSHPTLSAFAYPMSVNHVLTRSVRDSALLLDVAAGSVPGDGYWAPAPERPFIDEVGSDPGRLRIALSTVTPQGEPVHAECAAVTESTARVLEGLGHEVVEATPTYPLDDLQTVLRVVMSTPMAADIDDRLAARGRGLRDDDLEPFTHVIYHLGKNTTGTDMVRALQAVERAGHELARFFGHHDLLLTPTIAVPPPELGVLDTTNIESMYRNAGAISALTSFSNVTGQPAISLPLGRSPSTGLPLGVQLVARFGREDVLVQVASQIEVTTPWSAAPVWPPSSATAPVSSPPSR